MKSSTNCTATLRKSSKYFDSGLYSFHEIIEINKDFVKIENKKAVKGYSIFKTNSFVKNFSLIPF